MEQKIAYIVNHLGQSGVNNVVSDLINQFVQHGNKCVLFYLKSTDKPMKYACETRQICDEVFQYDVIHAHGLAPMLWVYRHKKQIKSCANHKIKLLTTLHCYCWADFLDSYSPLKGMVMGVLYLFLARQFDSIVCLSKHMMNYYSTFLPKKKLHYAYNTRDIQPIALTASELETLQKFKQKSVLLGMNCVLLKRKGIDVMLQALALLPSRFKLFIAGEGKEYNRFKKQSEHLGVASRVFFAGAKKQAHRYLPHYDIYVMPSRTEGFPLSLLEATFYAKPIVCSRLPIITECFSNKEIITFEMPCHEQLAKAILHAEKQPDIGVNAHHKFESTFSPTEFYKTYQALYGEEDNERNK